MDQITLPAIEPIDPMTVAEAKEEIQILQALMKATERYDGGTMNAIGALCGLIKDGCGWRKDNKAMRMMLLQIITGISQLESTKQMTAEVISVLIDNWKMPDTWRANARCKRLLVCISHQPEAFII